jgi:hypothetical protein
MRKIILLLAVMLLMGVSLANADIARPIRWSQTINMTSETEGYVEFNAAIEKGWHLYALQLPEGGPRPTTFDFSTVEGAEFTDEIQPSTAPYEKVDLIFHLKLGWWDEDVSFRRNFRLTGAEGCRIEGVITYQGCNDKSCIPPTKEPFELAYGSVSPAISTSSDSIASSSGESAVAAPMSLKNDAWWNPVVYPEIGGDAIKDVSGSSWWYIFIWGFLGGLLALLTPCVWPMIPLTVSFFLKRSANRSKAVGDAVIYGLAIIVIYLVLGLAITMIFGAGKLNDLATNATFNIIFFLLLVVFAVSFFGAFDIKLPSRWSNSMDSKAERTTGLISIFFMAFTLALVSFSCTGPIIGTLLVEAASMGDITGPAIGMGAFALALAIPFTLFAIFPSLLKEMPRSGGWLNSVKVVLGFLELALSLKFLSVADLAYGWGILDREVFVSLWIVIFALLGAYLLGKLRFSHDSETDHISIVRFFLALVSLSFAVYLVPGLWGAPLKGVSAFVPPLYTQDFNLYEGGQFREFHDYEEGMLYAAENNRPVIIDFSGYGCVNCRKMEGAVFDTQEVSAVIKENFVLIKLMVDDKAALSEPYTVMENGKKLKIESVGEKWSYLQRHKFAASTQPFYVILDNNGNALVKPYSYNENVAEFIEWLNLGLQQYSQKN